MKEVWVASPEKFNSPGHVHYLSLDKLYTFLSYQRPEIVQLDQPP